MDKIKLFDIKGDVSILSNQRKNFTLTEMELYK